MEFFIVEGVFVITGAFILTDLILLATHRRAVVPPVGLLVMGICQVMLSFAMAQKWIYIRNIDRNQPVNGLS